MSLLWHVFVICQCDCFPVQHKCGHVLHLLDFADSEKQL